MKNKRVLNKKDLQSLKFTEEEILKVESAAKKTRSFCEVSLILNKIVSRKVGESIAISSKLIENRISYNPGALRSILKAGELMRAES